MPYCATCSRAPRSVAASGGAPPATPPRSRSRAAPAAGERHDEAHRPVVLRRVEAIDDHPQLARPLLAAGLQAEALPLRHRRAERAVAIEVVEEGPAGEFGPAQLLLRPLP